MGDNTINRRGFIKRVGGVAACAIGFPYFIPSAALGKAGAVSPSNRIVMGCIGVGGMGSGDMRGFLNKPEVQVVAVCDVDRNHRNRARDNVNKKYGNADCIGYNDFREIIARDDIDAVMIATPDQWHAIPAIMAARAGKDIHAQKPLAYTIAEGRAIVDAVQQYGIVWQTGSQQRSDRRFRFACELVRNGRIGKVHTVKVGLPNRNSIGNRDTDPAPVPEGFDYDMWLGPAPWEPYCPGRCHWNFRWISDYSGGQITDWAGHHIDIAHWGMDTELSAPVEIEGSGIWPEDSLFDTVEDYIFTCKYAEGFTMLVSGKFPRGVLFEGDKGWIFVRRGKIDAEPKSLLDSVIGPNEIHLYESNDHRQNFLDCVKARSKTVAPVDVAHHSIMVGHLGVAAIKLGRKLKWDPKNERFINDDAANGTAE
ncbi:MAG: Gfo/Idh/MocA family protein [Planctomycetota bacterium]|jgi:predicted dehydrogenase